MKIHSTTSHRFYVLNMWKSESTICVIRKYLDIHRPYLLKENFNLVTPAL